MIIILKKNLGANNLRDFGRNFHWERAESGLNLDDAAKLINCHEQVLEKFEIGAMDLDMDLVVKLIEFYNLKLILRIEGRDD